MTPHRSQHSIHAARRADAQLVSRVISTKPAQCKACLFLHIRDALVTPHRSQHSIHAACRAEARLVLRVIYTKPMYCIARKFLHFRHALVTPGCELADGRMARHRRVQVQGSYRRFEGAAWLDRPTCHHGRRIGGGPPPCTRGNGRECRHDTSGARRLRSESPAEWMIRRGSACGWARPAHRRGKPAGHRGPPAPPELQGRHQTPPCQ